PKSKLWRFKRPTNTTKSTTTNMEATMVHAKGKAMPTNMTEDEKDRRAALATKMHDAVRDELVPANGRLEEIFQGMDQHIVIGAIADLAELLMVDCSWTLGDDF